MRHFKRLLLLFLGGGQTLLWPWWRSLPGERFPWHRWVRMSAAPRWGACWSGPRPRARRRHRRSARGRPRPWHGRGSDNGFAIHIEQYRDTWQTVVARRILPPRFLLTYYKWMTICSRRNSSEKLFKEPWYLFKTPYKRFGSSNHYQPRSGFLFLGRRFSIFRCCSWEDVFTHVPDLLLWWQGFSDPFSYVWKHFDLLALSNNFPEL